MRKAIFLSVLLGSALVGAASPVDLNTADQATLEKLGGIGPKKAQAILKYREAHGPFKSVDDLRQVPGLGEETFQGLKLQVSTQPSKE